VASYIGKPVNPDEILSALYRRLAEDAVFSALVNSIDKGPRRRKGWINPSCTVHLLTSPVDPESNILRGTAVVNVYMDDVQGRADTKGLGARAVEVGRLFHWAHDPRHPDGPITREGLRFLRITVAEPLILASDQSNEHLVSVRIMLAVQAV